MLRTAIAWAASFTIWMTFVPSTASADRASVPGIGAIAIGPSDIAVIDQLDAMLGAPVHRLPTPRGTSRDDYVVAASSVEERYVVVVDLRRARVYAFEPRVQRAVERAVPRGLVVGAPYAVAGIVVELLELLGVDGIGDVPEEPRPVDERSVDATESRTIDAPTPDARDSVFDGVNFGLGLHAAVALVDEPRTVGLGGRIELVLRIPRERRLVFGVSASGLGRASSASEQGSATAELSFRRTEVLVHAGLGRRLVRRLILVGRLDAGFGFGAIDVDVAGSGMSDRDEQVRWTSAILGVGVDLRVPLGRGFALGVGSSLDTILPAHDYSGPAGAAFHDSPVRFTFGLALFWGTSSFGFARPEHQLDGSR